MTTQKKDITQSEQYDHKLKSDLYALMLELQDNVVELKECEDRDDAESASAILMQVMFRLPTIVDAYMLCIDEGDNV